MTGIIIPIILLVAALVVVNLANRAHQRARAIRLKLRRYKREIANFEEVLSCMQSTLPNPMIAKYVNDEILNTLQRVYRLTANDDLDAVELAIKNAKERGDQIAAQTARHIAHYQKENDVQIAQTQLYIKEAALILKKQTAEGKLSEEEYRVYLSDLGWAELMVNVHSYIGQGERARRRGDIFGAPAFYQNAQHLLIESTHPNPRRLQMIRELSEILTGNRQDFSDELKPITEGNSEVPQSMP